MSRQTSNTQHTDYSVVWIWLAIGLITAILLVLIGLAGYGIYLLQHQGVLNSFRPQSNTVRSLNQNNSQLHFSCTNNSSDTLFFDGNYFALQLKNVLWSNNKSKDLITPFKPITDGYVRLNDGAIYNFSDETIKAVYQNDESMYLVIPQSLVMDWFNKKYLVIQSQRYVLRDSLQIYGWIPLDAPVWDPEILKSVVIPSVFGN